MKKTKVKMNKPAYLGMSILDISKTLIYEFWYDYVKPKYRDKAKLCYMDTALSFILRLTIFIKILSMMLKNGLTHQIMMIMLIYNFQNVRTRKKLVFSKMNYEERL